MIGLPIGGLSPDRRYRPPKIAAHQSLPFLKGRWAAVRRVGRDPTAPPNLLQTCDCLHDPSVCFADSSLPCEGSLWDSRPRTECEFAGNSHVNAALPAGRSVIAPTVALRAVASAAAFVDILCWAKLDIGKGDLTQYRRKCHGQFPGGQFGQGAILTAHSDLPLCLI